MTHPTPTNADDVTVRLLPCPFCGNDEGLTVGETSLDIVEWWSVECHGCNVSNTASTEAEAIAAWNTRAHQSAEVERLRPSDEELDPHLPDHLHSERRCGIQRSEWLTGWFVPWSPRNDNENAEGPWSHWVALAKEILAADKKARAALAIKGG